MTMMSELTLCGFGLLGLFGILQFMGQFVNRDHQELEKILNDLLQDLSPEEQESKTVKEHAHLYHKLHTLYGEMGRAMQKGPGKAWNAAYHDARNHCLSYVAYYSRELGENAFTFINSLNEQVRERVSSIHHSPLRSQLLVKKGQVELQKLKAQIQEELLLLHLRAKAS